MSKLAALFQSQPDLSFAKFKAEISRERRQSIALNKQIKLIKNGFIEVSPTLDPTSDGIEAKNFNWQGHSFSLGLARTQDGHFVVRVKSDEALPI